MSSSTSTTTPAVGMAGASLRFNLDSPQAQAPTMTQSLRDRQPAPGPAIMRFGGAAAAPASWVSPAGVGAAVQAATTADKGSSSAMAAPISNGGTASLIGAMNAGQSPASHIDPTTLRQAMSFYDQVSRNMAKWRSTPEYRYLAQVGVEGHLRMDAMISLPREILDLSAPISWDVTPAQKAEARQDLMSYLSSVKAAAPPGFTGVVGSGGRGGGGGGSKVSKLTPAQQITTGTLPLDEQILRVRLYNEHANLTATLDLLANRDVNGGRGPMIKSMMLLGAEESAMMRLPYHLKNATAEDFYMDGNARRLMAQLVGLCYRHAAASTGTGHLNRVVDDQAGGIRELVAVMGEHCRLVEYPVRHVKYMAPGFGSDYGGGYFASDPYGAGNYPSLNLL